MSFRNHSQKRSLLACLRKHPSLFMLFEKKTRMQRGTRLTRIPCLSQHKKRTRRQPPRPLRLHRPVLSNQTVSIPLLGLPGSSFPPLCRFPCITFMTLYGLSVAQDYFDNDQFVQGLLECDFLISPLSKQLKFW